MRSATSWIQTCFLVVAALRPLVGSAQSGAVPGIVVDARMPSGRFRLLGVAGPTARLTLPKPGYPGVFVAVAPGLVADESTLASAVGRVRAPAAVSSRPTATMQDLLGSGLTGVELTRAGGAIGFGGRIRIRGAASLLLSPDPLVYVNGIRVEGGSASQSRAFAGSGASPSRINDFDPEEIESIDVLKGPAAAALYGGDAANGVILITTKRGTPGRPAFEVRASAGANWLADPEGRFPSNYYVSRNGGVREFNVLRFNRDRGFPAVFSTGVPFGASGSLRGGTDRFRYYVSATAGRDVGYLDYNWSHRYGGRASLSYVSPARRIEIGVDVGFNRTKTSSASGVQPITGSILWACPFPGCEPATGPDSATTGWNGPGHGYAFLRPEDYDMVAAFDNATRATANFTVSHRPFGWLHHRLSVGPDLVRNDGSVQIDSDPTGGNPFFATNGTRSTSRFDGTLLSIDYTAGAEWRLGQTLAARTSLGGQRYSSKRDFGTALVRLDGLAAAEQHQGSTVTNLGLYLRQELTWRERLVLAGGLRASDDRYGDASAGRHTDPTIGISWRAVDRRAAPGVPVLSELRLRGGWGRIGRRGFGLPLQLEAASVGLEPETTGEWDAGVDAGFLAGRLALEASWYDRRSRNVLSLTGATGLTNGATIGGRGVEVALDGEIIRSPGARLDLRLTLSTNRSRIETLDGPAQFGQGSAFQANVAGFAPGSFFLRRLVHATLQTTSIGGIPLPSATGLQCEGGVDLGSGDGTVVPCSAAPRLYAGRPTPSWFGSASVALTLGRRLRLFGLVDYRGGNSVVVGDVFALHSFFLSSKQVLDGSDPVVVGYRDLGDAAGRTGLFKAGFARVRTVSAGYDLPGGRSVVFSIDNLAMLWREQAESFGVGWIDPEVIPNSPPAAGGLGVRGYTQDPMPQPIRVRVTLRLAF